MNNGQSNDFSYTYSARDRQELKRIRDKYAPPEEDKLERLRRLDAGVTKKARAWSITLGTLGTIVMGAGMSVCLEGPSEYFGIGVAVGIFGMLILAPAYPLYLQIVKRERQRIAPEIIRLTDELMK